MPARCAIIIFASILLAPVIGSSSPVLDMSVLPSAVGWTPFFTNGGTPSLSANVLTLDSPASGYAGYGAPAALWTAAVTHPNGWQVEARVRLLSQVTTSTFFGGAMLVVSTGAHRHLFELFTDHIALTDNPYSGTTSYTMDTTNAVHTYVLTGNGANIQVIVDGVPRLNATILASSSQQELQFGDLLFPNATVSEWTYVAFGTQGTVAVQPVTWTGIRALFR